MHDGFGRAEAVLGSIVLLVGGVLVEFSADSNVVFWFDLRSSWGLAMGGVISMVARFSKKRTLLALISIWFACLHLPEQLFLFLSGKLDLHRHWLTLYVDW